MTRPAAKGRKLILLAAACLAASLLLAPPAEATRGMLTSLRPSLEPPVVIPPAATAEPFFALLTGKDRFLFAALSGLQDEELAQVLDRRRFRPLSGPVSRELASGVSTSLVASISLGTSDLRWKSHQGDYFLEPDPLGPVDSPNLYQAFGFDGLNVTDPYGECWFTADNQSCLSAMGAVGKGLLIDTPLDLAKGVGNLATLGIAGRMYHEYSAGNVNSFADTMRVAGDAVTNTVTLGGRDLLEQGATGGQVAKEVSGVAAIERGSQTIGEGIGLGDGEMILSGVGEFAGGVGQVAGWSAGAAAVGKRAFSAAVPGRGGQAAIRARVEANTAQSQVARSASKFPTTAATNAQLEALTARAARVTDRLIQNKSTYWARVYHNPALRGQRFAAAFNKNPAWARSLIRGNIMDDVAKQMAAKANMPFLQITRRGVRGPDFTNQFLGKAWDVTTPGSWRRHVIRYANDPYDLLPLLY